MLAQTGIALAAGTVARQAPTTTQGQASVIQAVAVVGRTAQVQAVRVAPMRATAQAQAQQAAVPLIVAVVAAAAQQAQQVVAVQVVS